MRPLRIAGSERVGLTASNPARSTEGQDQSFQAEQAGIRALYAAKIEATRRSVSPHDLAAAIKALLDAQSAALAAFDDRRHVAGRASRQRRHAARRRYREALRQASGPPQT